MTIQVLRRIEEFSALRTEWNDLLSRSSADTIFLTWEWLFSWWQSYASPRDLLYIIVIREGTGELVGIVPTYVHFKPWLPLKTVKILRFIGDGSGDSDYLDAILLQGREDQVLNSVWEWLREQRGSWDLLQLSGIPENSRTCSWFQRTVDAGGVVSRTEKVPCLVTDLPDSWDSYVASLKPRFRTRIRSTLREVTGTPGFCFRTVQTEKDLASGLEKLYDLHGKRWETKGTEGVFRSSAKRGFYEHFTRLFLSQGWLSFEFLELAGNPVACQMCFRYGGTQFLLQEGFDPQFAPESVGIALRALVFKKAIADGIRHYDFLAGLGRHKTQWQTTLKCCQTISLGPKTVQNMLYLKVPVLLDSLRERIKGILPAKVLEFRRRLVAS